MTERESAEYPGSRRQAVSTSAGFIKGEHGGMRDVCVRTIKL